MPDAEPRRCRCGHRLNGDERVPLCPRCREAYVHQAAQTAAIAGGLVLALGGLALAGAKALGKLKR